MQLTKTENEALKVAGAVAQMSEGEKFDYLSGLPADKRTAYFDSLGKLEYLQTLAEARQDRRRKVKASKTNTARTYRNAAKLYNDYCTYIGAAAAFEFAPDDSPVIVEPITPPMMGAFIEHLYLNGNPIMKKRPYKYESIKTYCLGLSSLHSEAGEASPMTKAIYKGLNDIKELSQSEQAPEMRTKDFKRVIKDIDAATNKGARDKLLFLLGYLGGLRRSELASLEFSEVDKKTNYIELDDSGEVERINIILQTHKTARKHGAHIRSIDANEAAPHLCAVEVFKAWRDQSGGTGKIFKTVYQHGDKIKHTTHLTGDGINKLIGQYFGSDTKTGRLFSAHSFRVGLACALYRAGAPMEKIKRHMNWQGFKMLEHYTKKVQAKDVSPLPLLTVIYKADPAKVGLNIKAS